MWPNPQFSTALVTFIEKSLMKNFMFLTLKLIIYPNCKSKFIYLFSYLHIHLFTFYLL